MCLQANQTPRCSGLTEGIRQRERPKYKELNGTTSPPHMCPVLLKGYSDLPPNTTFLCILNLANTRRQRLGGPEEHTQKHRQTTIKYMCCERKWAWYSVSTGKTKPPFFKHTVHNRGANSPGRDSAAHTRWRDASILASPDVFGTFRVLTVCAEAETDPEGAGGLEGVLWSLRRSLRLRWRGELAGLNQGLRLRPDKIILCLHLWALPPLNDLRRKGGKELSERAAMYASIRRAAFI